VDAAAQLRATTDAAADGDYDAAPGASESGQLAGLIMQRANARPEAARQLHNYLTSALTQEGYQQRQQRQPQANAESSSVIFFRAQGSGDPFDALRAVAQLGSSTTVAFGGIVGRNTHDAADSNANAQEADRAVELTPLAVDDTMQTLINQLLQPIDLPEFIAAHQRATGALAS
jgi:hypothetical protein